ncbi:peptidase M17, partial [Micromonospora phytophila]|nr:peptidase M17 [Micromonospora phytophila]
MLAIRLLAEPDRLDTLALPVSPADDGPARPVPTVAVLPDGLAEEAAALAPVARLTGRAGEVQAQLRP